ncbi:NAD(P)-dependent alcohol dehydrogenase [Caulobacter sp. CCNWLY153]|uniref:NAD(P)-dependent alcohol dehydrogenase n=1 Tax=Caulobacter radicis TaxID=2172650 RepID=A0A2T9IYS4_9CAUL|nr:NAD(P)-dependent alcohol dehydrogenase [Caulobacter radicis]PVM72354.1 NAD(P)-dependent alcohol dehydrogenase [Caulobacter radicis]
MNALALSKPAGLDQIRAVDLGRPRDPGPGEIVVRLQASSLNYHDLAVALGYLPTAQGRIPLSDGAGRVEAVGPGVADLAVGDLVVSLFFPDWRDGRPPVADFSRTPGDGLDGYARSHVTAPASFFTQAPKGFDALQAASLTTAGLTAWRALVEGGVKPGDRVLVLGTGGVSVFALQFARMMGAQVAATSGSDDKLARIGALGADHRVNYRRQPDWSASILDWTDGVGVDHVIEVGGPATLGQSIAATRLGGHIALIGVLTGFSGEIPNAALMARQIRLQGVTVGSARHQKEMIKAIDANGLAPVIDQVFPVAELGQALGLIQAGGHFGKVGVDLTF